MAFQANISSHLYLASNWSADKHPPPTVSLRTLGSLLPDRCLGGAPIILIARLRAVSLGVAVLLAFWKGTPAGYGHTSSCLIARTLPPTPQACAFLTEVPLFPWRFPLCHLFTKKTNSECCARVESAEWRSAGSRPLHQDYITTEETPAPRHWEPGRDTEVPAIVRTETRGRISLIVT